MPLQEPPSVSVFATASPPSPGGSPDWNLLPTRTRAKAAAPQRGFTGKPTPRKGKAETSCTLSAPRIPSAAPHRVYSSWERLWGG